MSSGSLTYGDHFTPVQLIMKRGFANVAAQRVAMIHMHILDLKMCTGHISAVLSYRLYIVANHRNAVEKPSNLRRNAVESQASTRYSHLLHPRRFEKQPNQNHIPSSTSA